MGSQKKGRSKKTQAPQILNTKSILGRLSSKVETMKTVLLFLMCAAILQTTAMAQAVVGGTKQQTAPASKIQQNAVKPQAPAAKPTVPAQIAPKSASGPAAKSAPKPTSAAKPAATPANTGKTKKDGTRNMRYKENKKPAEKFK